MTLEILAIARCAASRQIFPSRVHREGHHSRLADDQRALRRPHVADPDVDLATSEVEDFVGGDEVDIQARVRFAKRRQRRNDHMLREPGRHRDADGTFRGAVRVPDRARGFR